MCKKASLIISDTCCGQLLEIPRCQLVKKVEELENKNIFLENQLKNAIKEIERIKNGGG